MSEPLPWLPLMAITYLEGYLSKRMTIFEWGSGGSTLYFAKRAKQVITIEHNREWYDKFSVPENVELRLVEPESGAIKKDMADPYSFYSDCLGDVNLKTYAKVITEYRQHFDVIMIDGRARPSCLLYARNRVVPGGILILDNAERDYYSAKMEPFRGKWSRMDINDWGPGSDSPWKTIIWKRYKSE